MRIKVAVSAAVVGLALLRVVFPGIQVDAITLGLLGIAALPWLAPFVQSAKLPGGWEVTFRDVYSAARKVTEDAANNGTEVSLWPSYLQDPHLALVALRVELEKRLRVLADSHQIDSNASLAQVLDDLQRRAVLAPEYADGLRGLVSAGNSAAHGATVEPAIAEWAIAFAPAVIDSLDKVVEVGVSVLNLRSGPGANYPVIARLQKGAPLEVLQRDDAWHKVRSDDGTEGWVNSVYIRQSR